MEVRHGEMHRHEGAAEAQELRAPGQKKSLYSAILRPGNMIESPAGKHSYLIVADCS